MNFPKHHKLIHTPNYKIVNQRKYRLVRTADRILDLSALIAPCVFPGQQSLPFQLDRILAVRCAYIGDIIMTLPALHALKTLYPQAKLYLLTSTSASHLLAAHPDIDSFIPYDPPWFYKIAVKKAIKDFFTMREQIRKLQPDLAIDFRADIRNIAFIIAQSRSLHRMSYSSGGGWRLLTHPIVWHRVSHKIEFHLDLLRGAGIPASSSDPRIYLNERDYEESHKLLQETGVQGEAPLIVIHPGSRVPTKRWGIQNFAVVAQHLEAQGARIIVAGSPEEHLISQPIVQACQRAISTLGKISIRGFAAMVAQSKLLIGNDSAPIHIAAAVGTPTVSIFGPSKPWETAPRGEMHRSVFVPIECRNSCDENSCSSESRYCLDAVLPEMVISAARELLSKDH